MHLYQIVAEWHNTGASKTQRLGQWFINKYVPGNQLPWPELFYVKDSDTALDMIGKYIYEDGMHRKPTQIQ